MTPKQMTFFGSCRIVIKQNGKIVHKQNALTRIDSVNMIASFLGGAPSPTTTPQIPNILSLEDASETTLNSTFTATLTNTSDIPLLDVDITEGALTVNSSTYVTYTADVVTPARVVYTVIIPAGFFPTGPQDLAAISVNSTTTGNTFSRVTFDMTIPVDDTTGFTIEYTYTLVPPSAV